MFTQKIKAEHIKPDDRITVITGDVAIIKKNIVRDDYCLFIFDNGLSFHVNKNEEIDIFRPIIDKNEINS